MAEAHTTADAAACSTGFFPARFERLRAVLRTVDVDEDEARVEAEIRVSNVHWSELRSALVTDVHWTELRSAYVTAGDVPVADLSSTSTSEPSCSESERTSEVETVKEWMERVGKDNVEVFRSLQARYPGGFFVDENDVEPDHVQKLPQWLIGGDYKRKAGEVKLSSEKPFAEGAQAQLFHAHMVFLDGESWKGFVMKVFKKGTSLRHLQILFPPSMLNDKHTQDEGWFVSDFCNFIYGARLLKADGRFAFLMARAWGDLQNLINLRMLHDSAPFSNELVVWCMWGIALGMRGLHAKGIVHRDLKAANVLIFGSIGVNEVSKFDPFLLKTHEFECVVADFECSVGVLGTRFWRAPEILLALKNQNFYENPEIFSKEADVYSYGMVCYEVLTGRIPFEELQGNDYDEVIGGARPILPRGTPPWMVDVVERCWHQDPSMRPTFDQLVEILETYIL